MNPNDVAPMVMSAVLFVSVAVVMIFRGPIGKAIARRLEGKAVTDPALLDRIDELEHRLAELEQERVDFTERLLAQKQAGGQLQAGTDSP